jgi:hypothetical protein
MGASRKGAPRKDRVCAAPPALGSISGARFPPLPPFDFAQGRLWANEFRRSAAYDAVAFLAFAFLRALRS